MEILGIKSNYYTRALIYGLISVLVLLILLEHKDLFDGHGPIKRYIHVSSNSFTEPKSATVVSIEKEWVSSRTNSYGYRLIYQWDNQGILCESSFISGNQALISEQEARRLSAGDRVEILTTKQGCKSIYKEGDPKRDLYATLIFICATFLTTFFMSLWFTSEERRIEKECKADRLRDMELESKLKRKIKDLGS